MTFPFGFCHQSLIFLTSPLTWLYYDTLTLYDTMFCLFVCLFVFLHILAITDKSMIQFELF